MTTKKHHTPSNLTKRLFRTEWEYLTIDERDTIEKALHRISIPRDTNHEFEEKSTFGQRAADAIASFGGSWTFIILFSCILLLWAFINTEVLGPRHAAFDPYPYVFLNLILSMLAALQAPVIMMSQNRQNARDRLDAEIDHEVNIRAELTVRDLDARMMDIESKLDAMHELLQQHAHHSSNAPTHSHERL